MEEINRTNKEVFDFFKDKSSILPVTQSYLANGWGEKEGKKSGYYIKYARCCKANGNLKKDPNLCYEHINNYKRIKKYLENEDFSAKFINITEMESLIDVRKISYNEGKPSQKWHLYASYFAQSIVEDDKPYSKFRWNNNFKKSISCRQLKLWMAEAAGVDVKKIEEAINDENEVEADKEICKISWEDIFEHIPQKL